MKRKRQLNQSSYHNHTRNQNQNQLQRIHNHSVLSSMEQRKIAKSSMDWLSGHSQSHSHGHSSHGPPSPCATSTSASTASSPATTNSIDYSLGSSGSNKITIRYLPTTTTTITTKSGRNGHGNGQSHRKQQYLSPSPSRSVLDPNYASRLYNNGNNNHHHNHHHHHHNRHNHSLSLSHDVPNNDLQLNPPPGILRSQTPRNNGGTGGGFSTPVASVSVSIASDTPEESTNASTMNTSTSTNYFTPERPGRNHSSSTSTLNTHYSNSAPLTFTTPSRGFYTPQSSPASKQQQQQQQRNNTTSFYSPNNATATTTATTPSRNGRLPPKSGNGEHHSLNSKHHHATLYSDRFIPSRASSNLTFSVWDDTRNRNHLSNTMNHVEEGNSNPNHPNDPASTTTTTGGGGDMDGTSPRQDGTSPNHMNQSSSSQPQPLLNALLRSELLGENLEPTMPPSTMSMNMSGNHHHSNHHHHHHHHHHDRNGRQGQGMVRSPLREGGNFLKFGQPRRQNYHDEVFRRSMGVGGNYNPTSVVDSFNLSPVGVKSSHRLMNMPQKRKRKIAKVPFKVLDAPSLADDFYLNLVDWSSLNVLAVGLGSCVYLWSACTSKVTKLCDLGTSSQDSVTSVSWTQRGTHLAVGVNIGEVQIWDTVKCKKIRTMGGHSARIGALSWSGATLASGSRDRLIYLRDVRIQQPFTARLAAHKQEVCGLKWSFDEPAHLASGGNDNKLLVWDIKNHRQPKHRFAEHTAAVKAIAWSPHQHGLLASGGGTADRCIRFWNALSGTSLNAIDTGSQVCNLSWSKNCNEIVSTHGYSLNQIAIWKYPTMQKVATLTGHTYRVLYLAMSPDGSTIVTGAGDETLRFWQVFPGPSSHDKSAGNGLLFPSSPGSILR